MTSARPGPEASITSPTRWWRLVDEALAGRWDRIEVTHPPDESVTVRDYGSGIPVDVMPDQGLPALTVVLTKLHAAGSSAGVRLQGSGGLHGVGHLGRGTRCSERADRGGERDGKTHRQELARGEPTTETTPTGRRRTRHHDQLQARPGVFEEIELERARRLHSTLRETAFLTRGAANRRHRRARPARRRASPLEGGSGDSRARKSTKRPDP